ncbi:MAG: VCBS repeat-containing protein [Candidatus Aminicenantes bacterium]|nr:VCBS repeat-containing protein [Candidatus Aminicenantes bacterium]
MSSGQKKKSLLSSWKEIAAYLDCDERTCRRWEKKHGLPINRIDKNSTARVYAFRNELDKWLSERTSDKTKSISFILPKSIISKFLLFLLLTIPLFLIFLFTTRIVKDRIPADFKVEGSTLFIINKRGRYLWSFYTGIENLIGDEHYKKHFQYRRRINTIVSYLPHIIIKDITNDKKPEVLFSIQTQDEFDEGKLICFDYKGNLVWDFKTGKELTYGEKAISQDYRIRGFDVSDLNGDGNFEIVIIASHQYRFPTQLVILNSQGQRLGEYWNSGRFSDLQFIDLNKDGRAEIVLSGCNNEYRKGCLIVFDTAHIRGGSPQNTEEFICKELEPGTEKYYILFPRTDLDLLEAKVEAISTIDDLENHRLLLLSLVGRILFELSYDLEIQSITLSHIFQQKHGLAHLEGKIKSELNEEYEENLKKGLLYYDGEKWISTPTMTSYWKNTALNGFVA